MNRFPALARIGDPITAMRVGVAPVEDGIAIKEGIPLPSLIGAETRLWPPMLWIPDGMGAPGVCATGGMVTTGTETMMTGTTKAIRGRDPSIAVTTTMMMTTMTMMTMTTMTTMTTTVVVVGMKTGRASSLMEIMVGLERGRKVAVAVQTILVVAANRRTEVLEFR